jgi:DNA-binding CsgD family transcriptional regulator
LGSEIVGRDEERAMLAAFLSRAPDAPSALVLEGEAGIGKSTLWLDGVDLARARGLRVLSSRPAEAERALVHVGLGDLLEDVLDDALPALAVPRRRALGVAMLRDDASGTPVDHRAVALAVRDVLQQLGKAEPVVVAIDDVQWLDASSSYALAFALRRLPASHVLVLLARRPADGSHSSTLEQALSPAQVRRVPVGPLSVGALHRLLADRLGTRFARQTSLRIREQSGGNPFFAIELARVLGTDPSPLDPFPVPKSLEELLGARIAGLPGSTLEALAFAAAVGTLSESLIQRAGIDSGVLQPAVEAHVIERIDGTIRFTHPLLASVLYRDLGESRCRVHATIARLADDPLVRARHLALSKEGPDADVAAVLDEAVSRAFEHGAVAASAELAEHALRLTPEDDSEARGRRTLAASRAHHVAGEWTRARALTTDLLTQPELRSWRAEAFILLAELSVDRIAVAELLHEALREATSPALQSAIHCRLAWATRFEGGFDHAAAALELAEQLEDAGLRARASAVQAILDWFAGNAQTRSDLAALTQHLPSSLGGERLVQEATQAIVSTLAPSSTRGRARALLESEYAEWLERDEPRSARALWGLAWVEFWAGRWELAAAHAARAHEISSQYGLEVPQDHLPVAVVAVHRGQLDLAREHSQRGLELAGEQWGFSPPQHVAVLGLVALWRGDPAAALALFGEADQRAATLGWGEPSVRWWTPDHVELLLEHGRVDDAVDLLDVWAADATRTARAWSLAGVTRCRGLVAAASGEVGGALEMLGQAVAEHAAVGDPFGVARARLALGTVRRRARQKSPARVVTAAALEGFESLGAVCWAQRARAELGQIGGRTRQEGLTAAERRVASLVAEGRTNKEIAAALFLGERTVASHLTHIYAKLGIRSRTELASRLRIGAPA